MATLLKNPTASSYFSSISQLNKKVLEESKELHCRHGWDDLSTEEQEKLLDELFISKLSDSDYDSDEQEISRFPDLKVKCGEKIVVDFENEDGWTWTDEHSGPFSWMTRSQQDLTLDEIFRDEENAKEKKVLQKNRPSSITDQPFNVKSFDDSLFSASGPTEMSEIEAAFQKFGISIPPDDDILPIQEEPDLDTFAEIDIVISSHPVHDSKNEGKKKHNQKSEYSTMSLPLATPQVDKTAFKDLSGHVSPVFVEDESPRVITDQPRGMLETYDNVPSYESYNQTKASASDVRNIHKDDVVDTEWAPSAMQSSPSVPSEYMVTSQLANESNIVESYEPTGVYIESSGETSDFAFEVTEVSRETPGEDEAVLNVSKTGFDFLDNW